jgi:proteic killer suppression protein
VELVVDVLHTTHVVCRGAVIQSFRDETTADLFRERNTRAARRIPREILRVAQRKLLLLDSVARLEDLLIPAGNRLERLKGRLFDRHSIRVNDQYRVTFRWENGSAYEVLVEDYH